MRRLFQKIEHCRHRPVHRWLALLGSQATGHGWRGWLPVEHAVPWEALTDKRLRRVVIQAGLAAMRATPRLGDRLRWFFTGWFDPNDRRLVRDNAIGIRYVPLTTRQHRRVGTRERLLEVRDRFPDFLTIQLGTLVTRVLLDDQRRAYGSNSGAVHGCTAPMSHPARRRASWARRTPHGRSSCRGVRSTHRSC